MHKWSSKIAFARSVGAAIALALLAAPLGGCYEGWDYNKGQGDGSGSGSGSEPAPPGPPPFFYILFEPVYFSDATIADLGGCFPKPGIAEFRKSEWAQRVATLAAVLKPLAVTFVMKPIEIAKDDCEKLSAVRSAAIDTAPWSPDAAPEDDPLDRRLVHVKAAFFEEDVSTDPPTVVTSQDWTAWRALQVAGRRALSVHHFVREHAAEGYIQSWSDALKDAPRKDGTPIDTVDPSDAGIAKRTDTIKNDAAAFASWLLGQI